MTATRDDSTRNHWRSQWHVADAVTTNPERSSCVCNGFPHQVRLGVREGGVRELAFVSWAFVNGRKQHHGIA